METYQHDHSPYADNHAARRTLRSTTQRIHLDDISFSLHKSRQVSFQDQCQDGAVSHVTLPDVIYS